ncbi:MAG TPA: antibiotic biosynthesis monooxygenase [Solirubrobacterales bacterium]|nr:antibiotic biosynthesis monooxygenase [Solirubrobacterales bacterium]
MPDAKKEIARYGKATANPGDGEALAALLVRAAEQNQDFPGCLQYEVNQSVFDPDVIWVTEKWADQESVDASLADERTREMIAEARPLIKDMEMVELVPLGGLRSRVAEIEAKIPRPGYTLENLEAVKNSAEEHGFGEFQESRFANEVLGLTQAGLSFHRIKPGQRQPFAHSHENSEEVYVVIAGSGRAMLGDDLVELNRYDAVRVAPSLIRAFEAGDDGLELLAFGQHLENDRGEMYTGWWGESPREDQ